MTKRATQRKAQLVPPLAVRLEPRLKHLKSSGINELMAELIREVTLISDDCEGLRQEIAALKKNCRPKR